jgi:hypothetical protein
MKLIVCCFYNVLLLAFCVLLCCFLIFNLTETEYPCATFNGEKEKVMILSVRCFGFSYSFPRWNCEVLIERVKLWATREGYDEGYTTLRVLVVQE